MHHIKIRTRKNIPTEAEQTPVDLPQRTLMDLQRVETYSPRLKCAEREHLYNKFLSSEISAEELLKISKANGKILLNDCLLIVLKKLSSGVRRIDLENYEYLLLSVKELLWYISPHTEKFLSKCAALPKPLLKLSELNNPKRHGHKIQNISQDTLLSLVDGVNTQFEKSFVMRPNFKSIRELVSSLIETCVKYSDYLAQNSSLQANFCSIDDESEPTYERKLFELPTVNNLEVYKIKREHEALESLIERLEKKDFYEPISVDYHFTERRSCRHAFYKHLKEQGITIESVMLFAQYYRGASGNKSFVWREDPRSTEHLINRNKTSPIIGQRK